MTTDITELAQSLKAAAIDAKELAIIARYSKGRAAAEKFYALANPSNVIALVEALEKAQGTITELENYKAGYFAQKEAADRRGGHLTRQALDILKQSQRIAELEEAEQKLCAANVTLDARAELAERQLAELESRTVKLPKRSVGEVMRMSGFSRDYAEGWCAGNDNAIHEIHNSGIKVEG